MSSADDEEPGIIGGCRRGGQGKEADERLSQHKTWAPQVPNPWSAAPNRELRIASHADRWCALARVHGHVLRAIRRLDPDLGAAWFRPTDYRGEDGTLRPSFDLTRQVRRVRALAVLSTRSRYIPLTAGTVN